MKVWKSVFVATLMGLSLLAQAGVGYKCKVVSATMLASDGKLSESNLSTVQVGREFVVDKSTGRMIGEVNNTHGQAQVLDLGSKQQAYKAITVYRPNIHVAYLYVQEFIVTNEKPFMHIDDSIILTGTCVNY